MYENGVWGAGEACEYVRAKILTHDKLGDTVVYGLSSYTFTGQMKYL